MWSMPARVTVAVRWCASQGARGSSMVRLHGGPAVLERTILACGLASTPHADGSMVSSVQAVVPLLDGGLRVDLGGAGGECSCLIASRAWEPVHAAKAS